MLSNSLEETKKIAQDFAATLRGGDVVFLEGELGTGKTTFTQGILESLGYTEPVRSPTFSIMNVYPIEYHALIKKIFHLDFYRFESSKEIQALGLEELFEDKHNVFLIEWPEKGFDDTSNIRYTKRVQFRAVSEEAREIIID